MTNTAAPAPTARHTLAEVLASYAHASAAVKLVSGSAAYSVQDAMAGTILDRIAAGNIDAAARATETFTEELAAVIADSEFFRAEDRERAEDLICDARAAL